MNDIYCGLHGALAREELSEHDRGMVEQLRAALLRQEDGTLSSWFNGDIHLIAPDVTDRSDYIIVDGKIQVAP